MTNGARLMLSTPPATNTSPSPQVTACAAIAIALRPLPQLRCKTEPGISIGSPATSAGMARDAAAVLARLIGAADDDILDLVRAKPLSPTTLAIDRGQHVVGPHLGERAGMAAERGAQTVIDIGVEHGRLR